MKAGQSILKPHCCCPMLLMQTVICLQTNANLHHSYGTMIACKPIFINNTLSIALFRLLEQFFHHNFILKKFDPYDHHDALGLSLSSTVRRLTTFSPHQTPIKMPSVSPPRLVTLMFSFTGPGRSAVNDNKMAAVLKKGTSSMACAAECDGSTTGSSLKETRM